MFLTIKTVYSCKTELFEIELIIYIKMDLALYNLQRLICHKPQPTNQPSSVTQNEPINWILYVYSLFLLIRIHFIYW